MLVVDSDLDRAQVISPAADGRWQAEVDTAAMIDPAVEHRLVAWRALDGAVSAAGRFRVERAWQTLADVDDPAGDDHGPPGRYQYPSDPSYLPLRTMDLRRGVVRGAGGALQIEIGLPGLSRVWNPPLGFDHAVLTVFIELPGQAGGSRVMPFQNGQLPEGMRWHRRLRVNGWTNALFSDTGADAQADGTPVAPAATVRTDLQRGTVTLTLPASALGRPATLSGARLYITTWDYDGGYRALVPTPQAWAIGGGDPAVDPLVMDALPVITLP